MKKNITKVYDGTNSKVADFLVNRLLPSHYIRTVGPIVFLDHVYPFTMNKETSPFPTGEFAHPHRGIATFSYVFEGSLSHYDSRGHHDIIGAGGLQWMKAGNGIIHDEQPFSTEENGNRYHSLQFWVNLPSEIKKEDPEYRSVQAQDVPEITLPDNSGILRVLLGEFGTVQSQIKTFSQEFILHLKINPKSSFTLNTRSGLEYAAFIPTSEVGINGQQIGKSKIVTFEADGSEIVFENPHVTSADIMVFGGAPYTEPIIAEGPFVMNSRSEIAEAYRDFFDDKYGKINYETRKEIDYARNVKVLP